MNFLTGVKATGEFHLGNYISSIKPIIEMSKNNNGYFFIADYHSLNGHPQSNLLKNNIRHIGSVILSFFDTNSNIKIYRQSKIPQIFELNTILSCFCSKGLLNRSHAYKSLVDKNRQNNKDDDYKINMGLYSYPILMSSDILIQNCDIIPVGIDQKQHIEIMIEIAQRINSFYKKDIFKIPQGYYQSEVTLKGLDGRKMSKSYNNVIPLFEEPKKIKKLINSIPTNFKNVGELKFENESDVTEIYKHISTQVEYDILLEKMKEGIGWGDVKFELYNSIINITKDIRDKYNEYMNNDFLYYDILEKNEYLVKKESEEKLNKIKNSIFGD